MIIWVDLVACVLILFQISLAQVDVKHPLSSYSLLQQVQGEFSFKVSSFATTKKESGRLEEIKVNRFDLADQITKATMFHSLNGLYIDPDSKEVTWLTQPCSDYGHERITEPLLDNSTESCDFYKQMFPTLISTFTDPSCSGKGGLSFSLDPWNPYNIWGPYYRKVYYPEDCASQLRSSIAGETLFEVDWDLKQLVNNTNNIGDFIPGYRSIDELLLDFPQLTATMMTRLWITISQIEVLYNEDKSMLMFGDVHLEVKAVNMIQNSRAASGLSDDLSGAALHPAYHIFIDNLNSNMLLIKQQLKSFRQFAQLGLAQEAVKFLFQRKAHLSEAEIQLLQQQFVNSPLRVPAVISTVERMRRITSLVRVNKSDDHDHVVIMSAVRDDQLLGTNNAPLTVLTSGSSDDAERYRCSITNGTLAQIEGFASFVEHNISLDCLSIDQLPSLSSSVMFSSSSVMTVDDQPDPCQPGVITVICDENDDEEGTSVSLPSSFVFYPGFLYQSYNITGEGRVVQLSTNLTAAEEGDFFSYPAEWSVTRDDIVLLALPEQEEKLPPPPSCALEQLLLTLQRHLVSGIIIIQQSKQSSQASKMTTMKLSESCFDSSNHNNNKTLHLPIRVMEFHDGSQLMNDLMNKKYTKNNLAMICHNIHAEEDSKDGFLNSTISNITFGDSIYMTLDHINPYSSSNRTGCQSSFLTIPSGFELVPPLQEIITHVILPYPWGTQRLGLQDGIWIDKTTLTITKTQLDYNGSGGIKPPFCARILIRSIAHWFPHSRYFYRTLDSAVVNENHTSSCQNSPLPLPTGWELAPAFFDIIIHVVKTNPWGTSAVIMQNKKAYYTAYDPRVAGTEFIQDGSALEETDHQNGSRLLLAAGICDTRILIRKPIIIDNELLSQRLNADEEDVILQKVGHKRQMADETSLLLTKFHPLYMNEPNNSHDDSRTTLVNNLYTAEMHCRTTILTHGGADMSHVRVVNIGTIPKHIERQARQAAAAAAATTGPNKKMINNITDFTTGKTYEASSTFSSYNNNNEEQQRFQEIYAFLQTNWNVFQGSVESLLHRSTIFTGSSASNNSSNSSSLLQSFHPADDETASQKRKTFQHNNDYSTMTSFIYTKDKSVSQQSSGNIIMNKKTNETTSAYSGVLVSSGIKKFYYGQTPSGQYRAIDCGVRLNTTAANPYYRCNLIPIGHDAVGRTNLQICMISLTSPSNNVMAKEYNWKGCIMTDMAEQVNNGDIIKVK